MDEGGPAGAETGVVPDAGVDEGGPAGVVTGVMPEAGVDDGGPAGVEASFPFDPFDPFDPGGPGPWLFGGGKRSWPIATWDELRALSTRPIRNELRAV